MRGIKGKGRWLILLGAVMTLGTAMTSMAAKSVKIRFENDVRSEWTEDIKVPKVTVNYDARNKGKGQMADTSGSGNDARYRHDVHGCEKC